MAKYIFGKYQDQDFCFENSDSGWKCENEFFKDVTFPANIDYKKVKLNILEKYSTVKFFKSHLNEDFSEDQLKEYLKTKLGCLVAGGKIEVTDLFNSPDDQSFTNLKNDVKQKLLDVAEGKEKERTLKTKLLKKAWITLRGANANIRNLNDKQGAYLFAYTKDGTVVEGVSGSKVYGWKIGVKNLDETEIQNRFEKALQVIDNSACVNSVKINSPAQGEAVLVTLDRNKSLGDINNIQKAFREAFTETDDSEKNILGKLFGAVVKTFQELFAKPGAPVDLSDYELMETTEIKMFYSEEEVEVAKEIIGLMGDIEKSDDKSPDEDSSEDEPKAKKPRTGFSSTTFGNRLRKVKAKYPKLYKAASYEAGKLKDDWNQESASVILDAASKAIKNSNWKDKKKLGDVLRQVNLIESEKSFKNDEELSDQEWIDQIITRVKEKLHLIPVENWPTNSDRCQMYYIDDQNKQPAVLGYYDDTVYLQIYGIRDYYERQCGSYGVCRHLGYESVDDAVDFLTSF